jgi:hypothetical protein
MWKGCSLFKMELEGAKAAGRLNTWIDVVRFIPEAHKPLPTPTNSTNLLIDQLSFNLRWESLNATI